MLCVVLWQFCGSICAEVLALANVCHILQRRIGQKLTGIFSMYLLNVGVFCFFPTKLTVFLLNNLHLPEQRATLHVHLFYKTKLTSLAEVQVSKGSVLLWTPGGCRMRLWTYSKNNVTSRICWIITPCVSNGRTMAWVQHSFLSPLSTF